MHCYMFFVCLLSQVTFDFHITKMRKDSKGEVIKTYDEISSFNPTSALQTSGEDYSVTETVTRTRIFRWDSKTAVNPSAKCSLKVPCFASVEVGLGLTETLTIGRDSRKDNTKTESKTFKVSVNAAPMMHVTATAHLMKYIIEIPYTATFKDKSRKPEEGVFETESYKLDIKYGEKAIESK